MNLEPRDKAEIFPKKIKMKLNLEISIISHQEEKKRKGNFSSGNSIYIGLKE